MGRGRKSFSSSTSNLRIIRFRGMFSDKITELDDNVLILFQLICAGSDHLIQFIYGKQDKQE